LAIQVVEDGTVFLVSHAFLGDLQDPGFAGAVDDDLFLQFGLQEPETFGDFVVEVAVIVGGGCLCVDEAEVAEFL